MKKSVVALRLSRLSIEKKIALARFIVQSMTGNANFTTPNPTLANITGAANALETTSLAAAGGGVDETSNMHAKEWVLDLALKSLGAYVEGIANANPETSDAVVKSAGMEIRASAIHKAREFHAETNGHPGEVRLSTFGSKRATFVFQMATDPAMETSWETIGQSTRAKMAKTGLASGTRYYFRVAMVDKNGQNPWSHVLNVIAP